VLLAFLIQSFLAFIEASFVVGIGFACTCTDKDHTPFKVASCIIKVVAVVYHPVASIVVNPFAKATSSFKEASDFATFVEA
jgi:hypothetical protein